jgi:hypothetical protein
MPVNSWNKRGWTVVWAVSQLSIASYIRRPYR